MSAAVRIQVAAATGPRPRRGHVLTARVSWTRWRSAGVAAATSQASSPLVLRGSAKDRLRQQIGERLAAQSLGSGDALPNILGNSRKITSRLRVGEDPGVAGALDQGRHRSHRGRLWLIKLSADLAANRPRRAIRPRSAVVDHRVSNLRPCRLVLLL